MAIKPVSGKIESQDINDNLSYLDSKVSRPLTSALASGEKVTMDLLANDVKEAMTGNTGITTAKGELENNRGVVYPLLNLVHEGEIYPVEDIVKNTVLSVTVTGAKQDKFYMVEYIGNGFLSQGVPTYGIQLSEYKRSSNLELANRRLLLSFNNDKAPKPTDVIVNRTIELEEEGLVFNIVYDNSQIEDGFGLNISNSGTGGRGRGCIIHPANYSYTQSWDKGALDIGMDYDTLFTPGNYYTGGPLIVENAKGLAVNIPSDILVFGAGTNYSATQIQVPSTGSNHNFYIRSRTTGSTWSEWKILGENQKGSSSINVYSGHSGVPNNARIEEFKEDYPLVSTNNKGAVMFRYDHGLTNFKSIIKQLHDERNFPYCIAMNSRNWDREENNGATQNDVKNWISDGLCEIWNHSATHEDTDVPEELYDIIVNGRIELEQQLGSKVHGFIVPGMSPTGMGGFVGGNSLDVFSKTYAGSLILAYHAVSSGAIPGTAQRKLDGVTRQGQSHFGIEKRSVTEVKAQIDHAIANKTALQLMMHPRVLNLSGYISTVELVEILDYVKTKFDSGDLVVLSPYQSLHATL